MFIIRYKKILLLVLVALLIFLSFFLPHLKIDYNLRSFLLEHDPDEVYFKEFNARFRNQEQTILISVGDNSGVFNPQFLVKLNDLTISLNQIPNIDKAFSLTTEKEFVKSPFGIISAPLIHIDDTTRYKADSIRIFENSFMPHWYISPDSKYAIIQLTIRDDLKIKEQQKLIMQIDSALRTREFKEVHMAGYLNSEIRYTHQIKSEMTRAILLSTLIMILVSYFIYRDFRIVLTIFIIIIGGNAYLYGYLGFFRGEVSLSSLLYPSLILIVAMSDFIHIYAGYIYKLRDFSDRPKAISLAIRELLLATFLTSFTTALGFFTFIITPIKAIRNFGEDAAFGIMITYIFTIVISMLLIPRFKPGRFYYLEEHFSGFDWPVILERIYQWTIKYSRQILVISGIALMVSIFGISLISNNSDLHSAIRERSPLKKDIDFFEKHFSGIRDLEIVFQANDNKSLNNLDFLSELEKLHNYMDELEETGLVLSPVTLYKTFQKARSGGLQKEFRLPETQEQIAELGQIINKLAEKNIRRLMTEDFTSARMLIRMKDIGRVGIKEFLINTDQWIRRNLELSSVGYKYTGLSLLFDKSNETLVINMLYSLLMAVISIGVLVSLIFKSLKMGIISLIPNLLPLMVIGGILGFAGIELHGTLAIIFTIGFVIAVDDTLHYLMRYRILMRSGFEKERAMYHTIHETGKAFIIKTCIIFCGFFFLIFSQFKAISYYGIFFSITSVVALACDLFLLPVLLRLLKEKSGNQSSIK